MATATQTDKIGSLALSFFMMSNLLMPLFPDFDNQ